MSRTVASEVPLHDVLQKRWSPRSFADRPVEPTKLHAVFEAARWAPSSYNEQPWGFLAAAREHAANYQKLLGLLVEFNQGWARSAPVLAFAVARLRLAKNGQPNRHAFYDLGAAVAHLTFQATAEGLFVHQMAGIHHEKAHAELGLPPHTEVVAALAIGYLGEPARLPDSLRSREATPSQRRPATESVFAGSWGTPLTFDGTAEVV